MYIKSGLAGLTLGISLLSAAELSDDLETNGFTSSTVSAAGLYEQEKENKVNSFNCNATQLIAEYKSGTKTFEDLKDFVHEFQCFVYTLIDEGKIDEAAIVFYSVWAVFLELSETTEDPKIRSLSTTFLLIEDYILIHE
jgi:hypothetical protein